MYVSAAGSSPRPPPRRRGLALAGCCARWARRAATLLVAINLGLLSPLSCVIHCAIVQISAEQPAISHFLCGEQRAAVASSASASELRVAPAPRALYELLSLPASSITPAGMQIAAVTADPSAGPRSVAVAPPTPPPRLAFA